MPLVSFFPSAIICFTVDSLYCVGDEGANGVVLLSIKNDVAAMIAIIKIPKISFRELFFIMVLPVFHVL